MLSVRKVLIAALIATGACTPYRLEFAAGNPAPHELAPRPPDAVVMLSIPPSAHYVEIGRVELRKTGVFPREDKVIAEMRREAGARGCDALVMARPDDDHLRYSGACIVYTSR